MKMLRALLLVAVTVVAGWQFASLASAHDGYYRPYRPYSYRSMSRTGKYHGYWRDMGYGFSGRGTRGYYLPQYNYYGGYGGGSYQGGYPPSPYVQPHYHGPHLQHGYGYR